MCVCWVGGGGGGRREWGGEEGVGRGENLHCHRQNDLCIQTGTDESHVNISFIVTGRQSHDTESIKSI